MAHRQQRLLSSNEKLYLSGEKNFSHLVMHALVEGSGTLEPRALEAALALVHRRLPGSRLRLAGRYWVADAGPPRLEVLRGFPDTRAGLDAFLHGHAPLDPRAGRTLSVSLASDRGRTLVAFRALHAAMDGQGMQIWMRAVFQALRGEEVAHEHSLLGEDDVLAAHPHAKRANEPLIPYATGPAMTKQNAEHAFRFAYARRSLQGTVPGLVARLAVGVERVLASAPGARAMVMVPVDVRPDLTGDDQRSMANLSLPLMLPLERGESWSRISQRLLDMLAAKQHIARGAWDWVYSRVPETLFSLVFRQHWLSSLKQGKFLVSALLSHTGRQNPAAYGDAGFTAEEITFFPCAVPIAPLSLVLTETPDRTEVALVASRALWDAAEPLLDRLLEAADLASRVLRKSARDRKVLARAVRSEQRTFPDAQLGLHQLVERQVEKTPEAVALVFEGEILSYRALNERANRLARVLRARGLSEGEFVGVGLERSFELIIAMLAIMKAKGAYVPLDPAQPAARLAYTVNDCQARFVVTRAAHRALFDGHAQLLVLDELTGQLAHEASENLELPVAPDDLCYLLYTSGSTGQPKGAMNHHGALTNHFLWMQEEYGLGSDDCTLQKTPIGFDASLLEVFLPLQCGARIAITRPEGHKDARYMLGLMREQRVTFLSIVPSVLDHFLDEIGAETHDALRLALVGGEEFSRNLYDRFTRRFPQARVENLYGPAEAAIDTLIFDGRKPFSGRAVPIGHPIANIEAYVVDERLVRVEPGEVGELVLAGVGIGRGYWNRPALTAEKFMPHPFRPDSPHRAYRTGDLVRELPDGALEFCGRIDHQVKIRGVRIELGEVEAQLEALPGVKRAVVLARSLSGQQVLVAYFVDERGQPGRSDELRAALRTALPEVMIPAVFVAMDALPLNASGKVDRTALPAPEAQLTPAEPFVPAHPTEATVAALWQLVLRAPPHRHGSFFDAGGNSLLAIALVSRVNESLGLRMHAQDLIETPQFGAFLARVVQGVERRA